MIFFQQSPFSLAWNLVWCRPRKLWNIFVVDTTMLHACCNSWAITPPPRFSCIIEQPTITRSLRAAQRYWLVLAGGLPWRKCRQKFAIPPRVEQPSAGREFQPGYLAEENQAAGAMVSVQLVSELSGLSNDDISSEESPKCFFNTKWIETYTRRLWRKYSNIPSCIKNKLPTNNSSFRMF